MGRKREGRDDRNIVRKEERRGGGKRRVEDRGKRTQGKVKK